MRGEFTGVWSETWREIWLPLIDHEGIPDDISVRQVLPALTRSQIQLLLRELRAEGSIHSVGMMKAARWYPAAGREELQP